jgi:hypothetical protein
MRLNVLKGLDFIYVNQDVPVPTQELIRVRRPYQYKKKDARGGKLCNGPPL